MDYVLYDGNFHILESSRYPDYVSCNNGKFSSSFPANTPDINYDDVDLINGHLLIKSTSNYSISQIQSLNGMTCFPRPIHDFYPSSSALIVSASAFVLVFFYCIYKWFIRLRG